MPPYRVAEQDVKQTAGNRAVVLHNTSSSINLICQLNLRSPNESFTWTPLCPSFLRTQLYCPSCALANLHVHQTMSRTDNQPYCHSCSLANLHPHQTLTRTDNQLHWFLCCLANLHMHQTFTCTGDYSYCPAEMLVYCTCIQHLYRQTASHGISLTDLKVCQGCITHACG